MLLCRVAVPPPCPTHTPGRSPSRPVNFLSMKNLDYGGWPFLQMPFEQQHMKIKVLLIIWNMVPNIFGDILKRSAHPCTSQNFKLITSCLPKYLEHFPDSPAKSSDCQKNFVFLPKQTSFESKPFVSLATQLHILLIMNLNKQLHLGVQNHIAIACVGVDSFPSVWSKQTCKWSSKTSKTLWISSSM